MTQERLIGAEPFRNATDIVFWYFAALRERRDGWTSPRWRNNGALRPIEMTDVQRAIVHGLRRRHLTDAHLAVLNKYGEEGLAPVLGYRAEMDNDVVLWREAIAFLDLMFRNKGVLATDPAHDPEPQRPPPAGSTAP